MKGRSEAMTSGELAKRLGVSDQTIRSWSDRFAAFLSPLASPPASRDGPRAVRTFTDEDAAALALVARLRSEARPYEEIAERLEAGERGEPARAEDPGEALEYPPAPVLWGQLQQARGELGTLREERDHLRGALAEEQARSRAAIERAARAEGRLEERDASEEREAQRAAPRPVEPASPAPLESESPPRSLWARLFGGDPKR